MNKKFENSENMLLLSSKLNRHTINKESNL